MGDAAGIGPEITVKMLARISAKHAFQPVVIGEKWVMESTTRELGLNIQFTNGITSNSSTFPVISLDLLKPGDFKMGKTDKICGDAAFRYFELAIRECRSGKGAGIVTAPLSKLAINLAGHRFIGHTEILEKKTGCESVMALVYNGLFISHVTDHLPLREALHAITPGRVEKVARLTWEALKSAGIPSPRLAMAGINPHAGEGGLLGREEIEVLQPAAGRLRRTGIPIEGPLSADTIFYSALKGRFDGVIAMYHDQGFSPIKTLDLAHGVNCTLGIPFIRTSPDHGTAFDIAGQGNADETSMVEAWRLAEQLGLKDT
jgi:4-hydroxythreonine-4-phosphate dehydrogenase